MAQQENAGAEAASPFAVPQVNLPKGGGAIRGIGEKFAANPVTGTASFSVPIATTPGRSNFGPTLALHYDSGAGNGPFGFGWHLALPSITRKTDKGLPRYVDDADSDTFILSGAEDLVPALVERDGRWAAHRAERAVDGRRYEIRRYRPRIEGLFARIERWKDLATGVLFWRSISADNVTTWYGRTPDSRIADPRDDRRIFSWQVCESYDDRGNAVVYEYKTEDGAGVDPDAPHERNRRAADRTANGYLKRIKYGNRISRLIEPDLTKASWLFEVVFDYGEGHYSEVPLDEGRAAAEQHRFVRADAVERQPWPVRPDAFSGRRAGFELRTYRRCMRVLMFHHIPASSSAADSCEGLVRSTAFEYDDLNYANSPSLHQELAHRGSTRFGSFLRAVVQSGYVRSGKDGLYLRQSLPPVAFAYSTPEIQETVHEVEAESLENLPSGLAAPFQWVDLDGEGVSGIVTQQAGALYYKPNAGEGRFGPQQLIASTPSTSSLASGKLMDLDGDGRLDLVSLGSPAPGFYARGNDAWERFRSFRQLPNVWWDDPNLRFIDLDGDGLADVLVTEEDAFTWHASLATDGFGEGRRVRQSFDEERGPRLLFGDASQSIYLADMCGDGLTDLVRIRNGEVCYWPNTGHGRFGAKVVMDNAPWFDHPGMFDQRRVRLADVDGSGTNDVLYLGRDAVRIYFNQSGNRLTQPRVLPQFPTADNVTTTVTTVDLLGNGTACLVWSSTASGHAARPVRYVDLMGGTKPHLLTEVDNHLGAVLRLRYAPSTRYYLADKHAGRPWLTRVPFPVHVLERAESYDEVSRTRFVTCYEYHYGVYDGVEREFRGFGRVDQYDTEEFAALSGSAPAANIDDASHVPPALIKTWYHTGTAYGPDHVSDFFAVLDEDRPSEYYLHAGSNPPAERLRLPDTVLPADLSPDEEREARRALKGSMLRQEIYALDGSDREQHPYLVTEQNFTVRVVQRRRANRHAVFFTHPRESLSIRYERNPADPRIGHAVTLEVDDFGKVVRSAAIAYGRTQTDPELTSDDRDTQHRTLITCTEHARTNGIDTDDAYRTPERSEARRFELTGLSDPDGCPFQFAQVDDAVRSASTLKPEDAPTSRRVEKRLIGDERTYFRRDDLGGALPLGVLESRALPHETLRLALTDGMVRSVYGDRVTSEMLERDALLIHADGDGDWWVSSGRLFFSAKPEATAAEELAEAAAHFFLPRRYRDPAFTASFNTDAVVTFDEHDLLLQETRDAVGNRITVLGQDYRVLQPALVMDANGNRSAVAFDALGLVTGSAIMGRAESSPVPGDRLTGFRADLTPAEVDRFMADPKAHAAALLGDATTRNVYDLSRRSRPRAPAVSASIGRERHASDAERGIHGRITVGFSYSDGYGREIQKKGEAEPDTTSAAVRWAVSGWRIFNNKGKPVREYEPFFSGTHHFEFDVRAGVSPVLFYDPIGRVVGTLHPNHAWQKVRFNPWRQDTWDLNDTVLAPDPRRDPDIGGFFQRLPREDYLPTWYQLRTDRDRAERHWNDPETRDAEREAAIKAAAHAETPIVAHADALGRTFLTVTYTRSVEADGTAALTPHRAEMHLDIEGNPHEIRDAAGRIVMRYAHDVRGDRIYRISMDAGERWQLTDALRRALYQWDGRGHRIHTTYDEIRRPLEARLAADDAAEVVVMRNVYGEGVEHAEERNCRGKLLRALDQSGVVENQEFDFKGNVLRSRRQFWKQYSGTIDCAGEPEPEPDSCSTEIEYDALNRSVRVAGPRRDAAGSPLNVVQRRYNNAGLLERVEVSLHDATTGLQAVEGVSYDAKGRRLRVDFGNGVSRRYEYDPLTSRTIRLVAARSGEAGAVLQDLRYTFDPAGNITRIRDVSRQTIFFRNKRAEPGNTYTYDALYRLVEATGREQLGQTGHPEPYSPHDRNRTGALHANDDAAMAPYTERYNYDTVGNLLRVQHRCHDADGGRWTRCYTYEEPSVIDPRAVSNRLSRTTVGQDSEVYSHDGDGFDAAGNHLRLPHLAALRWDYRDLLQMTQRQVRTDGDGAERTWYVYDTAGELTRKVTEGASGQPMRDRQYVGALEIGREYGANPIARETFHVSADNQRLAMIDTRVEGDEANVPAQVVRFQIGNHLGSSTVEVDERARVLSYEEYTPFGSTSYQATSAHVERKRYRYLGKERHEESGLCQHGVRHYAPWLGRWISTDPKELVDGSNLYAYGRNNPITNVDPTGTQCDPSMSCCVDATEPTPREEALQQSLPEEERYLPPPSALETPATTSEQTAESSPVPSSISLSISTGQYFFGQAVRPVDVNGNPLRGTYYLWSGDLDKNAAKALIATEGGWLMSQTPQHVQASAEFAAALRREAGTLFPGQTFTDQQLYAMAGKQITLPQAEMRAIWDPPSADVARRATLAGLPVQGNTVTTPGSNTVQTRIELPEVRRTGTLMGGLQVFAGGLSVYGGTQEEDPLLAGLGIGGGGVQIVGGATWIAGAWRASAPLMSFGTKASVVGTVITAPITISHAADDLQSGDEYRQLRGTLNTVGIVAPPAAFLSAYNEVFVKPAAETFYEVARRDIANMLGVPQSWVY